MRRSRSSRRFSRRAPPSRRPHSRQRRPRTVRSAWRGRARCASSAAIASCAPNASARCGRMRRGGRRWRLRARTARARGGGEEGGRALPNVPRANWREARRIGRAARRGADVQAAGEARGGGEGGTTAVADADAGCGCELAWWARRSGAGARDGPGAGRAYELVILYYAVELLSCVRVCMYDAARGIACGACSPASGVKFAGQS